MYLPVSSCRVPVSSDGDIKVDFDLSKASPPKPFDPFYTSVHPVGDEWEEAQEEAVRREEQEWREKVVVDDVHFHTYR